jgi:hydrogenase-4 component B
MSPSTILLVLFVLLCVGGVILSCVQAVERTPNIIAWISGIAAVIVIWLGAVSMVNPVPFSAVLWNIPSVGPILLRADPLSGLFLLLTGLVFLAASIFAANALLSLVGRSNARVYAVFHFALFISIVWLLIASDVYSFLIAWELMSILCYLLVSFPRSLPNRTLQPIDAKLIRTHEQQEEPNAKPGYLLLATGEVGALAMAVGLLLLGVGAGSLDFAGLKAAAPSLSESVRWSVFLLTFFGFGVKAGLVPVNFWLPYAYTAAPAAFVPVLAGATLNLGLYGIFRVNADLLPATSAGPGIVVLVIGTLSALVGILYATTDNDLKTLLAHSSIENAGVITVSLGAGLVFAAAEKPMLTAIAFLVALYHLTNHSLYKTLLFIGAGTIEQSTDTRSLDLLGGLIRRMPWTAAAFLAGTLSIAALPPFNGFVSEWLTLQTFLRSAELSSVGTKIVFALCGAGLALTAALAVTCFVKMFAMGFLGVSRSDQAEEAAESGSTALVAMGFLAILCLLLGVFPTYAIGLLDNVAKPLSHASAASALVPPFFASSTGHTELPGAFASEFHDLGAQIGQSILPGSGLVILHRGGAANPVVFAGAPTYLIVILAALVIVTFLVVRLALAKGRSIRRQPCWDGGILRLLPEMTYTATGFSNPVRVIFQAIFRPTIRENTRQTVAEHFRTAINREREEVHIVERFVLNPFRELAFRFARLVARMHQGRINAYTGYVLLALLCALLLGLFL